MRALWVCLPLLGAGTVLAAPPSALFAEASARGVVEGIDLSGWAVDPCPGGAPEIQVFLDGRLVLRGEPSQPLAEITERFKGWPPALFPGFAARLGTEQLGEGRRLLRVLVRSRCGTEKVLVVPGTGFGKPGHVRLSLAVSTETDVLRLQPVV